MEQLRELHEDGRVTYDVSPGHEGEVASYIAQAEVQLGYEDQPLTGVHVTANPGTSIEHNVLRIQPRTGNGAPLQVGDYPAISPREDVNTFPLEGATAFVDQFNGTDYHVILDSEPVELLTPSE